jgi:long-chain acyl-CoA synthetase
MVEPDSLLDMATPRRLDDYCTAYARTTPTAIAITRQNEADISYAQLDQAVNELCNSLSSLGVKPNDRVALIFENDPLVLPLLLAILRVGAIALPLNARLTEAELNAILEHADPSLMVCVGLWSEPLNNHASRLGCSVAQSSLGAFKLAQCQESEGLAQRYRNADLALLLYTSGSTGKPKGVMLSHANVGFVMELAAKMDWFKPGDNVYSVLPMSHAYGLITVALSALSQGAVLTVDSRFDVGAVYSQIVAGQIQAFLGVPTMYDKLISYAAETGQPAAPNRLRIAYVGGAPLDLMRKKQIEGLLGIPLLNGYGMSEASPTIARTEPSQSNSDLSVGRPVPGLEIRFLDSAGATVPGREGGKLCVRGPNIMVGYFKDPEATERVIDADGWLDTGDLARQENDGRLFIIGREKEVIINAGFNVYPAEVEEILRSAPGVHDAAVIGHAVNGNEMVVAFVELVGSSGATAASIIAAARDKLAGYKVPAHIFLEALPLTPTGKVAKAQLRERAALLLSSPAGR